MTDHFQRARESYGRFVQDKRVRAHCNECMRKTNHRIVAWHIGHAVDQLGEGGVDLLVRFFVSELIACQGCDSVSFRDNEYWPLNQHQRGLGWAPGAIGAGIVDPDLDPEPPIEIDWSSMVRMQSRLYPPLLARRMPEWRDALPPKIGSLMEEVYGALQADSRRLATMGARTLIDMVIDHKLGDLGTFRQKLDGLIRNGLISASQRDILGAALEVGNAAAHRGYAPTERDLATVMDIVEHLLQTVFVLDPSAAQLRDATPPRRRATKAKGEAEEEGIIQFHRYREPNERDA